MLPLKTLSVSPSKSQLNAHLHSRTLVGCHQRLQWATAPTATFHTSQILFPFHLLLRSQKRTGLMDELRLDQNFPNPNNSLSILTGPEWKLCCKVYSASKGERAMSNLIHYILIWNNPPKKNTPISKHLMNWGNLLYCHNIVLVVLSEIIIHEKWNNECPVQRRCECQDDIFVANTITTGFVHQLIIYLKTALDKSSMKSCKFSLISIKDEFGINNALAFYGR